MIELTLDGFNSVKIKVQRMSKVRFELDLITIKV